MLHRQHTPGFILPAQPVQSDMVGGARGSIAQSCVVARLGYFAPANAGGQMQAAPWRHPRAKHQRARLVPASPAKIVLSGDGNLRAWAKSANVA